MSKKRVFITHGFESSPQRNWFPWLKLQLEKEGIEVFMPALPCPEQPERKQWLDCLAAVVGSLDENTFLVAHSLGCITDLYFLSGAEQKIGGLILVAGFAEKLTSIPELADFSAAPVAFQKIIAHVPQRTVFGSPQDYIVPFELTKKMAVALDAKLVEIPDSGHFMQEDGYDTFPELLIELQEMMGSTIL